MASQLLGIKTRFTNDLGSPLVGGQVYTYFAGTSTNQDSYSDAALTVPNTNPVILDDTGSADIFLKGAYRIRVFDKSGRFIEEQDNVTQAASQGDATEIGERIDAIQIDVSAQKLDTGITATAKFGGVERTQADVNAETISLLDFGAPYKTDSTNHLKNAINYLEGIGGGTLYVPFNTGVLKLNGNVQLPSNVHLQFAEGLKIDCTANTSWVQFSSEGEKGEDIPLSSNVSTGDTILNVTTPHGLKVNDDVLLVSQRECAHEDAGEQWRLGETTAGSASPYFAEPLVVKRIISPTSFEVWQPIIFPDYNTDNSQESSPTARASSTISKMNYKQDFSIKGGQWLKEDGDLFYFKYTKNINIDIDVRQGYGQGVPLRNICSLSNKIKISCKRPYDWVIVASTVFYATAKDVSSWYSDITVIDENGRQGLDQTFTDYCNLMPVYDVYHKGSRGDAMTSHGCSYGMVANIVAINCTGAGIRNRARYSKIKVSAFNCANIADVSTWGAVDCSYDVHGIAIYETPFYVFSEGVTSATPAKKNLRVTGVIRVSPSHPFGAISISDLAQGEDALEWSGITLYNLDITCHGRAIMIGANINAVVLDNVNINRLGDRAGGVIWFKSGNAHRISNLTVDFKSGEVADNLALLIDNTGNGDASAASYNQNATVIDAESCKIKNGRLITSGAIGYNSSNLTLNGSDDGLTISRVYLNTKNFSKNYIINVVSGTNVSNRVVLDTSLPLLEDISILFINNRQLPVTLTFYPDQSGDGELLLIGGNDGSNRVTVDKYSIVNVKRVGDEKYIAKVL